MYVVLASYKCTMYTANNFRIQVNQNQIHLTLYIYYVLQCNEVF